jgi:hypothetical protein
LVRPPIKDRHQQRRNDTPRASAGPEQAGQVRAGCSQAARQRDLREERGPGGADIGVLRAQHGLRLQDIWAPRKQVGRQAGRNIGQDRLRIEVQWRRQIVRQRLADQQDQRVFRLRAQP